MDLALHLPSRAKLGPTYTTTLLLGSMTLRVCEARRSEKKCDEEKLRNVRTNYGIILAA